MNFKKQIESCEAFKKLNIIQRELILKRSNRLILENGVKVATYMGYDNWEKICQYNQNNKDIVKEIVEKNPNELYSEVSKNIKAVAARSQRRSVEMLAEVPLIIKYS